MPERKPVESELGLSSDLILGELRGQMREVIHAMNNIGTKVDGLYREVGTLTILATDVADLKVRMKEVEGWAQRRDKLPETVSEIDDRLRTVERKDERQNGAKGAFDWIVHSPLIGWIAAAAAVVWAKLTGGAL